MATVELVEQPRGLIRRMAWWYSKRAFGNVPEPTRAAAIHKGVTMSWGPWKWPPARPGDAWIPTYVGSPFRPPPEPSDVPGALTSAISKESNKVWTRGRSGMYPGGERVAPTMNRNESFLNMPRRQRRRRCSFQKISSPNCTSFSPKRRWWNLQRGWLSKTSGLVSTVVYGSEARASRIAVM